MVSDGLPELTTPVAYLSVYPTDIFPLKGEEREPILYGICTSVSTYYYIWSLGPDLLDQHGDPLYDPTNGAISTGDILMKSKP